MIPLGNPKKHGDRHWQIGPYDIKLLEHEEDTEASAWKAAMVAMHAGEHKYAETFKIADYHWMIDGNRVVLPESSGGIPLPDTEEIARSVLAEAQAEM